MAFVPSNQPFLNRPVPAWLPPISPVVAQQGVSLEPLFWTLGAIGAVVILSKLLEVPVRVRYCATCGKAGHSSPRCSHDTANRVPLRMAKTGWCSCCKRHSGRTEAHHYAGPADGTKGREMCGTCHIVCGHDGDWRNMARNPRYCRL